MSDDHSTAAGPAAPHLDMLDGVAGAVGALDTTAVRERLLADSGAHHWPRFRVNEVELEWRRWRIRHALGSEEEPPASIKLFERFGVEAGVAPAARAPEVAEQGGPLAGLPYDALFPQGPLVAKAVRERVVREPADREGDEEYQARVAASARRRADYLRKLTGEAYWWQIADLLSERDAVACAREAEALPPSAGAYFSGGPEPGWDVEHDALVSKSSNAYLGQGPRLIDIHEDAGLVDLISARMGRRMYPTRCTYLRYKEGDYLGVHTDQPTCEVSVLFVVDGEPGPMRSYLDQTERDPFWLDRWVLDNGHFPEGGRDVIYQRREALALAGRAVPHARLPQAEHAIVGALFYSGLV